MLKINKKIAQFLNIKSIIFSLLAVIILASFLGYIQFENIKFNDKNAVENELFGIIRVINTDPISGKLVISFDPAEFLSGEQAQKACLDDPKCYKDEICIKSGSCLPSGYFLLNEDPHATDMTLAKNVLIEVLEETTTGMTTKTINVTEFKKLIDDGNFSKNIPFWVKLQNQEVIGIRQKYLP